MAAAKKRLGRGDWIAAALDVIVDRGIAAVSVESLAKQLGVTKGSFYWHFDGRLDLLRAVLDTWEREGTSRIIEAVEDHAQDPAGRLERLVHLTARPTRYDELEGALRSWARTSDEAAAAVVRVDRRRLRYVTDLLVGLGITRSRARLRAHVFYRTLIGELSYRASGGRALPRRALEEIVSFLRSD